MESGSIKDLIDWCNQEILDPHPVNEWCTGAENECEKNKHFTRRIFNTSNGVADAVATIFSSGSGGSRCLRPNKPSSQSLILLKIPCV